MTESPILSTQTPVESETKSEVNNVPETPTDGLVQDSGRLGSEIERAMYGLPETATNEEIAQASQEAVARIERAMYGLSETATNDEIIQLLTNAMANKGLGGLHSLNPAPAFSFG